MRLLNAYAARGRAAYWVRSLALNVLYWFYEVGTSRLAIRDQPLPSKPIIPEWICIIHYGCKKSINLRNLIYENISVTPLKLGQSDEIDNVNAPQTCMILGILWDETFKKA